MQSFIMLRPLLKFKGANTVLRKTLIFLLIFINATAAIAAGKRFAIIPTIKITASVSTAICPGTPVTFSASITDGGSNPVYQWKKNTINVGTNSPVYTDNNLINGDVIICVLSSNSPLANPLVVASDPISIMVNDGLNSKVSTYAGNISTGWPYDFEGPATAASLDHALYFTFDNKGNMYLTSGTDNAVKKITAATGMIGRYVNTDTPWLSRGFSGDGGPARNAKLDYPKGLCVDSKGNLIIADGQNHRIRKVDAITGIINTIAGTGWQDSLGDGGPANLAALHGPTGICVDSADNIYFMDTYNRRIRRIDGITGIITTVARTRGYLSLANQDFVEFITMGPCGEIYFTDSLNFCVLKLNPTTGNIRRIAGDDKLPRGFSGDGGLAAYAQFNGVWGINFDKWENLYIADIGNDRIRKVDATTGIIKTVAGDGNSINDVDGKPALNTALYHPSYIKSDEAGNIYVAEYWGNRIRKLSGMSANLTASMPVINLPDSNLCKGNSVVMDIFQCADSVKGLNAAKEWTWYAGSCGGTLIGKGASITVSPLTTTTYFVRGEGDCISPGSCASRTVYVYDPGSPSITIASDLSGLICRGTPVKFSSISTKEGTTPHYQWKRNGNSVGADTNIFTSSSLLNGDVITCELTSNAPCAIPVSVSSNAITITLYPDSVTLSPKIADICPAGTALLTASGGLVYQWFLNGIAIPGATGANYTATQQGNYLVKVTNVNCVIPESADVILHTPSATVSPATAPICIGTTRLLTSTPANAYQWFFNGVAIPGATSSTHLAMNAGSYKVQVSDGFCNAESNTSLLIATASAKSIRYNTVRVARNKPWTLAARNIGQNYLWQPATGLNNPAIKNPEVITSQDRLYTVRISNPMECAYIDTVFVQVFDKPAVYVPSAFSPNGDGNNDILRPIPVHIKEVKYFKIWNRWGMEIFNSKAFEKAWDGKLNGKAVDAGVYVWAYEAVDIDGKILKGKGTTVLIR